MAQLSRPFQLALVLVAVLALAWFTVLRAHLSTNAPTSSSSGSSTPSSTTASSAGKAGEFEHDEGRPTPVYHGAAPGLHGLSKDIRRAHETVGASQAEAHRLEGGSTTSPVKAGGSAPAAAPSAASSTVKSSDPASLTDRRKASVTHPQSLAAKHPAAVTHSAQAGAGHHASGPVSRASTVESQLHAGRIVLLLFWSPGSSEDRAVHAQVQAAGRSLKARVALDFAKAGEVGSFGTVTRDISVLQTPTLLIINQKGLATTITGLTDAFSIEQAVREAGA